MTYGVSVTKIEVNYAEVTTMKGNSALKASLKVQLLADQVLVAESDDPQLWQEIFSSIQTGQPLNQPVKEKSVQSSISFEADTTLTQNSAVKSFARDIGITEDDVLAACHPDNNPPYIHLDDHYWEAFKKNIPARGPKSVATIALPAALLYLWMKHAKIGASPSIKQCKEVLATIHVADKNVARSIKNTEWLQRRGDTLIINPTMRSKAIKLVKAYCLRQGLEDDL